MQINERQTLVLEHLARYSHLTVNQLVTLGIAPQVRNIRNRYLHPLYKNQLIDYGAFNFSNRPLPHIYFLTKKGASLLAELWRVPKVYYPVGKIQFTRDYAHRVGLVDCMISMELWAKEEGHEIDFMDFYFQVEGSQKKGMQKLIRKTQVNLRGNIIVPDCNFRLFMKDGQSRLYTLELHRQPKTRRIIEQLRQHAEIIHERLLSDKYDHEHLNYVLSVHSHSGDLQQAIKTISNSPTFEEVNQGFYFTDFETIKSRWNQGWISKGRKLF